MHHGHIEDLRWRIGVQWSAITLTFVLVLFFLVGYLFEDETLIVWIKHFKIGFGVVDLIFCLDGTDKSLEFDEGTAFFFDEDDFGDFTEVGEDVIEAIMIILFWKRADEEYFGWTIFLHKLFWVGVDDGFWFSSVDFYCLIPLPEFLAFECNLSKLLINIHKIIEWAIFFRFEGWFGFWFVLGGGWTECGFFI